MTISFTRSALLAALVAVSVAAAALLPVPASAAGEPASSAPGSGDTDAGYDRSTQWNRWRDERTFHRHNSNDVVSVGHDAHLAAGAMIDSVVAVFGSATNNGTARRDVVSVFGDTTVNGPAAGSAVAVLGNVVVNADIGHDVVAVLGDVNLGPAAHVHGHVVSILGAVHQDPAAVVDEGVERVLPENIATAAGIRRWVGHGLMIGRPLVIGTGLQWLWGLSFACLAVYTILALLFRDATDHCIATLQLNPGKSLLTAILAVLLTPLLLLLLTITLVGILVIPIALVTLFCAAVFGKTTVLGWIGNRCFGIRPGHSAPHPALAVLVGGIIVMLAYLVPILGFVVFVLLGMLGYGAVLYALLNRIRRTTAVNPAGGVPPFAQRPATKQSPSPGTASADTATPAPPGPGFAGSEAPPLPPSILPRATFWIRMGALLIDAIIVWAVVHLLLEWPREGSNRIGILALAVYGAVMWKVKGTTVGGIACNLRVVRLDSRPLDWPTAWVRALGCILSLCALGLGFFWIAVDPDKQAWHDKLAGTIVVRVPAGTPLL